ncbi:nuclear speckle RNA-binding protein B-like isoform X2 [Humulus lupulus]|uniref:nuclear speckle RNA-binding protein B-like isoform X2 n=1 Tax=Humulus lupulus TaxID=3486 RepID=UPI002B4111CD|nr:nuclear speckle RNA-binding protein B-like isoform X2 [Humulus lupulus]
MEPSEYQPGKSPKKELQGPRPTPLKIHKGSHKIKKPPVVPQQLQPALPPRQPVIIYTVSPKIIHTKASEFRDLVQRLTGLPSSTLGAAAAADMAVDATTTTSSSSTTTITSSTSTTSSTITNYTTSNPNLYGSHFMMSGGGGVISPAARYAATEKAKSPPGKIKGRHFNIGNSHDHHIHQYFGMNSSSGGNITSHHGVESGLMEIDHDHGDHHHHHHHHDGMENNNKGFFSGILSPGPASLPPIHPNFFSPLSDSFFHDLSPVLQANRSSFNIDQGSFMMPSPASNYFISPRIASPNTPSIDLLLSNIFSDHNL